MKWFKHDANASLDSKLQKVKLKYGMEGYGLYWYLLECVARNVESHNLTFELEDDAEIVSASTGIHQERVQEMMMFMIKLNLFEESSGRIYCLKMATRTDEYTQKLIKSSDYVPMLSRHAPDKVRSIRREENRIDENRKENIRLCFEEVWTQYPERDGNKKKTQDKITKQLMNGRTEEDLRSAITNYLENVRLKRENGFRDLRYQNRQTWFNNWEQWIEWEKPEQPQRKRLMTMAELEAAAEEEERARKLC